MANTVVIEALTWLNTPYHHQGRVKGAGTDCAMILCEVYEACGLVPHIDPRPYPPDWHLHRSEERYLRWIEDYADKVDEPLPGDVALYQFGRTISHGAIVVEWPTIIHAYRGEGVVLADGTQGALAGRLAGFWRVRSR
jgi:cell wall-associated NlpC family hydrolase